MTARVAAHQGTETIAIRLTFIAQHTLIPGVIAVGMLARSGATRPGTTGLVLVFATFAYLFWSSAAGAGNIALGAARIGMHPGTTSALLNGIGAIPATGLGPAIFGGGHIAGLVLPAAALWRGRVVFAVPALDGCARVPDRGRLRRRRDGAAPRACPGPRRTCSAGPRERSRLDGPITRPREKQHPAKGELHGKE
jgi:hypothetical protein